MFKCFPILLVIVVVDVITTLRQAEVCVDESVGTYYTVIDGCS